MKKLITAFLLIILTIPNSFSEELIDLEKQVLTFGLDNSCKKRSDYKESDIPTIFIPGILASWYSEEGYGETNIKRWIPDPISHSYDTLFKTFHANGYNLRDVFYKGEFETYIKDNPKHSLYLFGYDWKKDNKITARLLSDLVLKIREKYEEENGCDIGTVNIIGHSMGGLVARAMLEDMCATDEAIVNYNSENTIPQMYSNSYEGDGLKKITTEKCYNFTKINHFITISTPHRGSPNSFPLWERGDINQTDPLFKSLLLKWQLGSVKNDSFYKTIHGYNSKIKNGIITIGQLLPDLNNKNYNKELFYLYKNNKELKSRNYPTNSFLELLNREENIEKMFFNIKGEYTLYYSTLTGNNDDFNLFTKNNIIGYNIEDIYAGSQKGPFLKDLTTQYTGKDIYSYYPKLIKQNIYNIDSKITNEKGLGGDGTVATNNLLLSSNDTGKIYTNKNTDNLKVEKIQCYDDELFKQKGYDLENIEDILTKKLGKIPLEMCSHTKMPIVTAIRVYESISGNKLRYDKDDKVSIQNEQDELYKYIGYADYTKNYKRLKNGITSSGYGLESTYVPGTYNLVMGGIQNNDELNERFGTGVYINLFKNNDEVISFLNDRDNNDYDRKKLDFSGLSGQVDSLLRYEILSPINIIIEDEQGRKIGIDPDTGLIINEIPGAWTSGDTEGSNEPEFFLIPKSGTGQVKHKINTYGTGDGEYNIVMNEIKIDDDVGGAEEVGLVIAGIANKGEQEKYIVGIEGDKSGYVKIDSSNSKIFKQDELDRKYGEVFQKIKEILDQKYTSRKRGNLKLRLSKMKELGFGKFDSNEKVVYLIEKILEYLK